MKFKLITYFHYFGRLCLASTFATAIPSKVFKFQIFVDLITKKGISSNIAEILMLGAILVLTLGVIFLLLNQDLRIGITFLLIFLVPTTIIIHTMPFQLTPLLMNLGLIGSLIIILTTYSPQTKHPEKNILGKYLSDFIGIIKKLI
tara:strand:- start:493 stop:930 length:438 start_codon:yes stop_codon:yes gene_type:complete